MVDETEQQLWSVLQDIYKCLAGQKLEDEPMVAVHIPVRVVKKLNILVPGKVKRIEKMKARSE